jgi:hypothetical protein
MYRLGIKIHFTAVADRFKFQLVLLVKVRSTVYAMTLQAFPPIDGSEALERLRAVVQSGKPIVGAGAGTGISAKFIEQGGVDLLILCTCSRPLMGKKRLRIIESYGRQFRAVQNGRARFFSWPNALCTQTSCIYIH